MLKTAVLKCQPSILLPGCRARDAGHAADDGRRHMWGLMGVILLVLILAAFSYYVFRDE